MRSPGATVSASATTVALACIGLDRVDDLRVAGAAAEVAFERVPDLFTLRSRIALEEDQRGQQHPRRAEAALHRAVAHERVLQRVEPPVALEPAYGDDRSATHARGEQETARHRAAVEQHGARPADAFAAAFLDVEDPERVAQ